MIAKINQIVGSWIRSTAERLIRHGFGPAIPLRDQSSGRQRRTRF
jgi:hypothetical protein